MSTPERQQDPGEYGYGGAKQEPDEEGSDDAGEPSTDASASPASDEEPEPDA